MASALSFPFPKPFAAWLIVSSQHVDKGSRKLSLNFLTAPLPNGASGQARRVIAIFDNVDSASRFARGAQAGVEDSRPELRCLEFPPRRLLAVLRNLHSKQQVHGVLHGPRDVRPGLRLHIFEIEQVIATLERMTAAGSDESN
jgi:hypothetical protein